MEENKRHYGWIIGFFAVLLVFSYLASRPTTPLPSSPLGNATSSREGWLTALEDDQFTFLYPADFDTTYISPVDWPPVAELVSEPFSCSPAGVTTARSGATRSRIIDNKELCITEVVEGAAGSTYTQRAYAFAYGTSTAILTFTTRHPQCANYPDPERSVCEAEQNSLDLDLVVRQIVDTISLVPNND